MAKHDAQAQLRREALWLLDGGNAHVSAEDALGDVPPELWGATVAGVPYSLWQQLEHLRIAQWDILEFSRNADHRSPQWPEGYWPASAAPPDEGAWDRSRQQYRTDGAAFRALVASPRADLFAPFAWGEGQTLLREALLLADHNAYHLGQVLVIRRALRCWGD